MNTTLKALSDISEIVEQIYQILNKNCETKNHSLKILSEISVTFSNTHKTTLKH